MTRKLSADRHNAALDAFITKTASNTPEADAYAKAINEHQWAIVKHGKFGMDDAFVLAVEAND